LYVKLNPPVAVFPLNLPNLANVFKPASLKGRSAVVKFVPCPITLPAANESLNTFHLSVTKLPVFAVVTAVKLAKFVLVPRWLILMSPLISAFRNGANPACAAPVFGFTYNPLAPAAAM